MWPCILSIMLLKSSSIGTVHVIVLDTEKPAFPKQLIIVSSDTASHDDYS